MRARSRRDDGQILVLFVLALVAMFAMSSLLFDAGNALVRKRQLQDAGDAAALAAANVIQSGTTRGCSTTLGPPLGTPRAEVVTAAQTAVTAALPGFNTSNIVVTCPNVSWAGNYAVQVDLSDRSPGYFGGVIGFSGFGIGTTSQAVNGQVGSLKYSVVELDPSNFNSTPSWPQQYNGCPSVNFAGNNNIIFDGSLQVDSACQAVNKGALTVTGNSATLQFATGTSINLVGEYKAGTYNLVPPPLIHQPIVRDPLAGLPAIPWTSASFPVRSTTPLTIGNARVLKPGLYTGGITMNAQGVAYLEPGIYVMNGGGFTMKAGSTVYSIPVGMNPTTNPTSNTSWATDCARANCGVLIFNTNLTSSTDSINVMANANLMLRPYLSTADGTNVNESAYDNLLIWQDGSPAPTSSWVQPQVSLSGGGFINISGTLYAPSAIVNMGGTSGGSGGDVDVTMQFISWDLTFNGNIGFHFYYRSDAFARPTDYGLIK